MQYKSQSFWESLFRVNINLHLSLHNTILFHFASVTIRTTHVVRDPLHLFYLDFLHQVEIWEKFRWDPTPHTQKLDHILKTLPNSQSIAVSIKEIHFVECQKWLLKENKSTFQRWVDGFVLLVIYQDENFKTFVHIYIYPSASCHHSLNSQPICQEQKLLFVRCSNFRIAMFVFLEGMLLSVQSTPQPKWTNK